MADWYKEKHLHVQGNLSKCQVMVMSKTSEGVTPTEVKIDQHTILNTEQIQLPVLGITLDSKLGFTYHYHLATISRTTRDNKAY